MWIVEGRGGFCLTSRAWAVKRNCIKLGWALGNKKWMGETTHQLGLQMKVKKRFLGAVEKVPVYLHLFDFLKLPITRPIIS